MAFTIENGVLVKYTEEDGVTEVVIPEGVTEIGDNAFANCLHLTSVVIPESVTRIGYGAFWWCKMLNKIIIPESAASIEGGAFSHCMNLTSVVIPEGVKRIGEQAFVSCKRLADITIPDSLLDIQDNAFDDTEWYQKQRGDFIMHGAWLLRYRGADSAVTIPQGVSKIAGNAFSHTRHQVVSIAIPEGVTSIGTAAFCECELVEELTIPYSVQHIGYMAFGEMKALKRLTIQGIAIDMSDDAFRLKKEADFYCKPDIIDLHSERWDRFFAMLETRNFSQKFPSHFMPVKRLGITGFYLHTDDTDAGGFVKRNIAKIMPLLIEHNNPDAIRKLLERSGFVTKRNIDQFIEYAIEQGNIEIQTMLMHHKAEVLGYTDPAEAFKL